jgi:hypothetical protein
MWGYGDRHDKLSSGALDPLYAEALVIRTGAYKLAIVSLDLGRSPAEASLQRIRARIRAEAGIEHSIIAGSHTHHGPVLELTDEPGKGKGRFDAALRYYREMEDAIAAAILEANAKLAPATLASGAVQLSGFNRNRHTKLEPKPSDRELSVLRFDDPATARPRVILVNFAAHPTMLPSSTLKFSADYVGALKTLVAAETGAANVLFLQGAAADQSVDAPDRDHVAYGRRLGREAVKLAGSLHPAAPVQPSLAVREERFRFASRTDFSNGLIRAMYAQAFFPELIPNFADEYADGIRPRLTVALLDADTAFVAASGEFFSAQALRLKERARIPRLFFISCANGYHQYFPTIEAAAEGGYGADAAVSPVAIGAGEQIMDTALIRIYQLLGKMKN